MYGDAPSIYGGNTTLKLKKFLEYVHCACRTKTWKTLPESEFPDSYNLEVYKSRMNKSLLGKRTLSWTLFQLGKELVSGVNKHMFNCLYSHCPCRGGT